MAPKMAEVDQVSFKSMMAGLVRSEWCNIKKMVFRVFEVYALFRWFQVISVSLHVHVRVKCEYKQSDSVFILHTKLFSSQFTCSLYFQPFFSWCQLLEKDQKKCPESAFKFLFYSSAYGYCSYMLFNGKYNFFQDTSNCWKG